MFYIKRDFLVLSYGLYDRSVEQDPGDQVPGLNPTCSNIKVAKSFPYYKKSLLRAETIVRFLLRHVFVFMNHYKKVMTPGVRKKVGRILSHRQHPSQTHSNFHISRSRHMAGTLQRANTTHSLTLNRKGLEGRK